MKPKMLITAALAFLSMSYIDAKEYTWANRLGDGDWSKPGNFIIGDDLENGEAATVCPGGEDTVWIPAGVTVMLEYDSNDISKKASCDAFSSIMHIRPSAKDSVIEITVPEGEIYNVEAAITCGKNEENYDVGHIVKKGLGELYLNSLGKIDAKEYYDYYCAITVDEGILRLYSGDTMLSEHYNVGKVTVNENGTLFTTYSGSSSGTVFSHLYGNGTLTNDFLQANNRMMVAVAGEFGGRLTGSIYFYSQGRMRLTGTESISTAPNFAVYQNYDRGITADKYGSAGIMKFGLKAVDGVPSPSSIGYADTIYSRDHGSALLYLGQGETTDKDLVVWPQATKEPTYIDGGEHGGLHWTGSWRDRIDYATSYQPYMKRIILQGSNAQECVMSGTIKSHKKGSTNYTFSITKKGPGVWRMKHNDDSDMLGVWRILEGTLRFDTIAETNVNSSLGKATMLYKDLSGVLAMDSNKVDYAFWIGRDVAGQRANLEYVGATNCISTTRRFAMNGVGGILNNGVGRIWLEGFYATNTASTLVLGGSNALENVAGCVCDGGNAVLSVTKEDSGTWRIGSKSAFSGALTVKKGRLVIGNEAQYNYYRWIIKGTFWDTAERNGSNSQKFGMTSFGLFDADGNDRVYGITDEGEFTEEKYYSGLKYNYGNFPSADFGLLGIGEGRVRITHYDGSVFRYSRTNASTIPGLFMHRVMDVNNDTAPYVWCRDPQLPPWPTSTDTWVVFTMRPVKGTPITSWDYVNSHCGGSKDKAYYQYIKTCELQASVNGRKWDSLSNLDYDGYEVEYRPKAGTWRSDNTTIYDPNYKTHIGMPIPAGPTDSVTFNASSVSVASGAELVARSPNALVISRLVVDGREGGGKIEGFTFAESGEIEVMNPPVSNRYDIPMEIENAVGLNGTVNWTVSVDGVVKPLLKTKVTSSGVCIWTTGTQIVIR